MECCQKLSSITEFEVVVYSRVYGLHFTVVICCVMYILCAVIAGQAQNTDDLSVIFIVGEEPPMTMTVYSCLSENVI